MYLEFVKDCEKVFRSKRIYLQRFSREFRLWKDHSFLIWFSCPQKSSHFFRLELQKSQCLVGDVQRLELDMTHCFVLFCVFGSSQNAKMSFFFFFYSWDVICLLTWNGEQARCQDCFHNLPKNMHHKFNIKSGYILCQVLCFYFLQIYFIISSLASFIYRGDSWIKFSVFIKLDLYWWNSLPSRATIFTKMCFIFFFLQKYSLSAFNGDWCGLSVNHMPF